MTHTCCVGCKDMNSKFECTRRNLNCTLWFCDRLLPHLKGIDLENFSMIAKELIQDGRNRYRTESFLSKWFQRKTYYGTLAKIYILYFKPIPKALLLIKLFFHCLKLQIKTLRTKKIYTCK